MVRCKTMAASALVFWSAVLIGCAGSTVATEPTPATGLLSRGDTVVLEEKDGRGLNHISLCETIGNFDDLTLPLSSQVLEKMLADGSVFTVSAGTSAVILESGKRKGFALYRVVIQNGESAGKKGWVTSSAVKKEEQK